MDSKKETQHVYLVGAKSLGAYGGYETFVYKLTEYHQNSHHRMAAFYAELVAPKSVVKVANAHNTFTDKKKLTRLAYRNTKVIAVGEMVKKNLMEYAMIVASLVEINLTHMIVFMALAIVAFGCERKGIDS